MKFLHRFAPSLVMIAFAMTLTNCGSSSQEIRSSGATSATNPTATSGNSPPD